MRVHGLAFCSLRFLLRKWSIRNVKGRSYLDSRKAEIVLQRWLVKSLARFLAESRVKLNPA